MTKQKGGKEGGTIGTRPPPLPSSGKTFPSPRQPPSFILRKSNKYAEGYWAVSSDNASAVPSSEGTSSEVSPSSAQPSKVPTYYPWWAVPLQLLQLVTAMYQCSRYLPRLRFLKYPRRSHLRPPGDPWIFLLWQPGQLFLVLSTSSHSFFNWTDCAPIVRTKIHSPPLISPSHLFGIPTLTCPPPTVHRSVSLPNFLGQPHKTYSEVAAPPPKSSHLINLICNHRDPHHFLSILASLLNGLSLSLSNLDPIRKSYYHLDGAYSGDA